LHQGNQTKNLEVTPLRQFILRLGSLTWKRKHRKKHNHKPLVPARKEKGKGTGTACQYEEAKYKSQTYLFAVERNICKLSFPFKGGRFFTTQENFTLAPS
jgi:hypothetical protein